MRRLYGKCLSPRALEPQSCPRVGAASAPAREYAHAARARAIREMEIRMRARTRGVADWNSATSSSLSSSCGAHSDAQKSRTPECISTCPRVRICTKRPLMGMHIAMRSAGMHMRIRILWETHINTRAAYTPAYGNAYRHAATPAAAPAPRLSRASATKITSRHVKSNHTESNQPHFAISNKHSNQIKSYQIQRIK